MKIGDAVVGLSAYSKAGKDAFDFQRFGGPRACRIVGRRDHIAVTLCYAIAATRDKAAIEKAKRMRRDRYERRVLDIPPDPKASPQPEPQ